MEFGCCIRNIEDVRRTKEAGFDYFEFSASAVAAMDECGFDSLLDASLSNGIRCSGFNAFSGGDPMLVGNDHDISRLLDYTQKLCVRGQRLGISSIGIGAPKARIIPEGFPAEEANRQIRDFLLQAADISGRYGITILLEAVHSGMCNFLNTTAECLQILDSLGRADGGIVFDLYQSEAMGEAPRTVLEAGEAIRHVHVSSDEGSNARAFPHPGDIEKYTSFFENLRAIGYSGTLSIEPDSFDDKEASECLKMLKRAYERAGE